MAGNKVVLTFVGEHRDLSRTITTLGNELNAVSRSASRSSGVMRGLYGAMSGVGAVGSAVQTVAALGTSVANMAGAALLAPAALLGAAAAGAALKIGMSGVADAIGGDAEALAKLAPAARDTVSALTSMKPAWDGVKSTVQGNLFAGVAGDVRELGASYLPVLRSGLGSVATGWNQMGRNALGALKSTESVGVVNSALTVTSGVLQRAQESVGAFLSGFMTLGGAGLRSVTTLGAGLTDLGFRFEAWTQKVTGDGSFEAWVARAKQEFSDLFATIVNLGTIVSTVITGLAGPTGSFFGSLRQTTDMIKQFLQSAQGQTALATLGETLRVVGDVMRNVLMTALQQIGPLIVAIAPAFQQMATVLGGMLVGALTVLGPLLTGLATFLSHNAPLVTALTVGFVALWAALQVGAAVTGAVSAATTAWAAAQAIVRGATVAWTGVQWLLNAALSANPIGIVVVAIAALVAALVYAWNNSETFRSVVLSVWSAVQSGISAAVGFIRSAISWFGQLPGLVSGWFNGAKNGAVNALSSLVGWVRGIPGMILGALGNLGSLLVSSGRSLLEGLWNGISGAVGWLKSKVSGVLSSIRDLFPFSPAKEGPFSGSGYTINSGLALATDFGRGILGGMPSVLGAVDTMLGAAQGNITGSLSAGVSYGGAPAAASSGPATVTFAGNTSDALATVIMMLIRSGKIQVSR